MGSYNLIRMRRRRQDRNRRELAGYVVITGAILAAAVYLFTASAGMDYLWKAVQRAVHHTSTVSTPRQLLREHRAEVTLTPRPPDILP